MSATALLQTSQHKHCHIGYIIVATRILVSKVRTCVEYSTRVTVVLRFDTCYHMSNTYANLEGRLYSKYPKGGIL